MSPFFSIVIPTFNRAEKLGRALESVERQTFRDFEVLVCDDGSSDGSKDVVASFEKRLTVRYLWEENWGGPARPRNRGVNAARGEWICFLDADDWWYPGKLETVARSIERSDVIYHELDPIPAKGWLMSRLFRSRQLTENAFVDLMLGTNTIKTSSAAARKRIIEEAGGFTEERTLIAAEDFDLWLKIARRTSRFTYIPDVLGAYEQGQDSITETSERQIQRLRTVYGKHLPFLTQSDRTQAELLLQYLIARIRQRMGMFPEALDLYRASFASSNTRYKLHSLAMMLLIYCKPILPGRWIRI